MPMEFGATWSAFYQITATAPTTELNGAGGSAQTNVAAMLFDYGWGSEYVIIPAAEPATQLNGAGGSAQTNVAAMLFDYGWGSEYTVIPEAVPPSDELEGAGGSTQALVTSMLFDSGWDSSYAIAGSIPQAVFTYTIQDPVNFPRRVKFDASPSSGGGSPYSAMWSFGDGKGAGNSTTFTHDYETFDTYTVTLTVTQQGGIGLAVQSSQQVVVEDTRGQPDESAAEVLNMEVGYHLYEPVRTTGGKTLTTDDAIRQYAQTTAIVAQEVDVVTYTATGPTTITHVRVGGTHDGRFRLLVDGEDVIPARRIFHSLRGEDLLDGAVIAVAKGAVVKVKALHQGEAGTGTATYEAALIGRKS